MMAGNTKPSAIPSWGKAAMIVIIVVILDNHNVKSESGSLEEEEEKFTWLPNTPMAVALLI